MKIDYAGILGLVLEMRFHFLVFHSFRICLQLIDLNVGLRQGNHLWQNVGHV